jgi:uncharacterized protein
LYHRFLQIESYNSLQSHPKLGASFEGFAIDAVCRSTGLPPESFYYYRTHNGAELDLFWQHNGYNWGVECKFNDAPKLTGSAVILREDLALRHLRIIYPGKENWEIDRDVSVKGLSSIEEEWVYPG